MLDTTTPLVEMTDISISFGGIRAVDHCVEGFCSNEAHPYGDAQALKGLSLLASALPRVKANARDLEARLDCQLGTWLSMGASPSLA